MINKCGTCKEVMPRHYKLCYCGGAVKEVEPEMDELERADSYAHRKWLYYRSIQEVSE